MRCLEYVNKMFGVPILIPILLCFGVNVSRGEIFSANSQLKDVVSLEIEIDDILEKYLNKLEENMVKLKEFLANKPPWHRNSSRRQDLEEGNPILAYHIIKRLTVDLNTLEQNLEKNDWRVVSRKIERAKLKGAIPLEQDLHGAAQALIRIQDVYDLDIWALSQGKLLHVETKSALTASDCLYLGKYAYNAQLYTRAIEWFEQALNLSMTTNNPRSTTDLAQNLLLLAEREHDQKLKNGILSDYLHPLPVSKKTARLQREDKILNRRFALGKHLTAYQELENFKALCRGEQLMLNRARVQSGSNKEDGNVSNQRTSKVSWTDENDHLLMLKLATRISRITGLRTDSRIGDSEKFQVANYGLGGHYSPHTDFLITGKSAAEFKNMNQEFLVLGDRIATFMFYLSDVEIGGFTSFPRIGAVIRPSKGSAAFWYNLKRSGKADIMSYHGACPVVLGNKWVMNKWIREKAQIFTRSCSLDVND
ncbi:prolyl 4-hydroxylase subunit alpha-2-like isoform X2 [Artemia franciscana]|uniref:prolyl 4-hydroxylase subunit alpha-2-like isoform X2 n=1 Tax=Artemia franciscana TaxID=6661 RepID=UPI0032D9AEEB